MTRRIGAPREVVWARIRDVARHHEWRGDVKRTELESDVGGRSGFREFGAHGPILYAIDVDEPPSKFVTRITDESLPYGGSWTIELEPRGSETDVTITERGFVSNPIFRFLSKTVFSPTATMQTYLNALAVRFEHGG